MPGKKYFTKRYYTYFEMLSDMLNYDSNAFYKTIMDGNDVKVPYGNGNISLKILMSSVANTVNEIKPHQTEKLVNGQIETVTEYGWNLNQIKQNEEELARLKEEFNTIFATYKQAHPTAADDNYMSEYKKFEYLENVFKLYDAQQKDFEIYEQAQGPDYPADADIDYDDTAEVDEVNDRIATYKTEQRQLYRVMDNLDSFIDSANFDVDILSDSLKEDLGDKQLNSQNLFNEGLWVRFGNDIQAAVNKNNNDIETLKAETQVKLAVQLKELNNSIDQLKKEGQSKIDKINADFADGFNGRNEIVNNLNEDLAKLKEDNSAIKVVAEKLDVSREKKENVSPKYFINESGLTELSDTQIEEKITANNKSVEMLDKNTEELNAQIAELQIQLNEKTKAVDEARAAMDSFENDPETIKLIKESQDATKLADKAEAVLAKANKRGGINNLTADDLTSIGLDAPLKYSVQSNKTTDEAVKAIYKIIGNDKMTGKIIHTDTQYSKALGESVKYLDEFFNNGGFNTLVQQYKAEHDSNFKYDLDSAIKAQFTTMENFAGPNRRGQIYTAEDAMDTYELYRISGRLRNFAETTLSAPFFKEAKDNMEKAIKAIEDVVDRPELAAAFADIAANVAEFGTQAQRANKIKRSIENVVITNRQLAADKDLEKDEKQLALMDKANSLDDERMQMEEQIEGLQNQINQNNLDKEYLASANEVFTAVKGINVHKGKVAELEDAVRESKSRAAAAQKKVEDSIGEILKQTEKAIAERNAQHEKAKANIRREAGHKYNLLMADKDNLHKLSYKFGEVKSNIVGIQSTVRVLHQKEDLFTAKRDKALGRLNLSKKAVMDQMFEMEKQLVERMAGTKKFFSDSDKFTKMRDELVGYINGNKDADNSALTAESYRAKIGTAKQLIETYIANRDDNKWTESGQIRLDTAKGLLQIFAKKEQMLNQYAEESLKINSASSKIGKIKIISQAEENIFKQADPDRQVNDYETEFMAPAQRRFAEGLGKIQEIFAPLKEGLAEKSQYLTQKVENGINALAKGNIKAFTEAVAAVITCKDVEGRKQMDAFNKKPEAFEILNKGYAKSPEVQGLAKQLITQEISPKEFIESLTDENMTAIKQKTKENAVKTEHKIEDLNIKGLQ